MLTYTLSPFNPKLVIVHNDPTRLVYIDSMPYRIVGSKTIKRKGVQINHWTGWYTETCESVPVMIVEKAE